MESKTNFCTDMLFARPSFFSGAARALDLGGTFDKYNSSPTGEDADFLALRGDWAIVGKDMEAAIEEITK